MTAEDWQKELDEISDKLTAACRSVDPTSTDEIIQQLKPVIQWLMCRASPFGKNEPVLGFGEGIPNVENHVECGELILTQIQQRVINRLTFIGGSGESRPVDWSPCLATGAMSFAGSDVAAFAGEALSVQ